MNKHTDTADCIDLVLTRKLDESQLKRDLDTFHAARIAAAQEQQDEPATAHRKQA